MKLSQTDKQTFQILLTELTAISRSVTEIQPIISLLENLFSALNNEENLPEPGAIVTQNNDEDCVREFSARYRQILLTYYQGSAEGLNPESIPQLKEMLFPFLIALCEYYPVNDKALPEGLAHGLAHEALPICYATSCFILKNNRAYFTTGHLADRAVFMKQNNPLGLEDDNAPDQLMEQKVPHPVSQHVFMDEMELQLNRYLDKNPHDEQESINNISFWIIFFMEASLVIGLLVISLIDAPLIKKIEQPEKYSTKELEGFKAEIHSHEFKIYFVLGHILLTILTHSIVRLLEEKKINKADHAWLNQNHTAHKILALFELIESKRKDLPKEIETACPSIVIDIEEEKNAAEDKPLLTSSSNPFHQRHLRLDWMKKNNLIRDHLESKESDNSADKTYRKKNF